MALIPVRNTASSYFEIDTATAIKIQTQLIKEWEPIREVWSLKYGHYILGGAAAISGLVINSIFRRKLKVLHHGLFLSTTSLAIAPAFVATLNHNVLITKKFLLYDKNCLACDYLKTISIMQFASIILPIFAAPVINIAVAGKLGYRVPYMSEGRELLKFWWNAVKPASNRLLVLAICNTIICSVIVYKQSCAIDNVMNILLRLQKKIDDGIIKLKE